jgi:hypothetical protein
MQLCFSEYSASCMQGLKVCVIHVQIAATCECDYNLRLLRQNYVFIIHVEMIVKLLCCANVDCYTDVQCLMKFQTE